MKAWAIRVAAAARATIADQRAMAAAQAEHDAGKGGKEHKEPERSEGFGEAGQGSLGAGVAVGKVLGD